MDGMELFTRYTGNPILTAEDWPYRVNAVFNPGAIECGGETVLLVRVEDMRGMSHLTVARSADGFSNWRIDTQPTLAPDPENYPEEVWGVEDPRIVYLEELGAYAVTYTSFSMGGPLVSLALTKDFRSFERRGAIMPPEDKDACLFPRRFGGRWALIHRPMPSRAFGDGAHIWISFSHDLQHWGEHKILLPARRGGWWDANKVGLGPQPIETEHGWLLLYHGVRSTASGSLYRVGVALLDLEDPTKVLRRSDQWIFGPRETYERLGDVPGVTFPTGVIVDRDKDEVRMYYGAADTSVAVAMAKFSELVDYVLHCPEPD
jgi:predicted GH43/DUF377 family glycosyl hydrolase